MTGFSRNIPSLKLLNSGQIPHTIEGKLDVLIELNRLLVDASETELVSLDRDFGFVDITSVSPATPVPLPTSIGVTGYQLISIYNTFHRTSPELYISNEGSGDVYIRISNEGANYREQEIAVLQGEVRVLYDVWDILARATRSGTRLRITEYDLVKQRDVPFRAGNPYVSETSVALAGTPNTEDANAFLGSNAHSGYITNDGPGNLLVQLSSDGITFTSNITVIPNQILDLEREDVDTVRIDASVNATAYRMAAH